ncbi:MAG: hypothetical protein LUD68_09955, partial [Rikenellaceae bacterium]|nr:hypothetical protein [Rikenellaceae bacterium]
DHRFRVMAGHEMASVKTITGTYRTTGFPSDIEPKKAIANIGKGSGNTHSSTESAPDRNLSFFGSLNYDYDSRYFLTATFRADGSTKFAPGNQ